MSADWCGACGKARRGCETSHGCDRPAGRHAPDGRRAWARRRQADPAQPGALPPDQRRVRRRHHGRRQRRPGPGGDRARPPRGSGAGPLRARRRSSSARACSASTTTVARWWRRSTRPSSTTPPSATTSSSCRSTRSRRGSRSRTSSGSRRNCTLADGTPIPKVLPWDTVRVSGHKVGLFGLTLHGRLSQAAYRCTDPDSAAHLAIDTLAAQGADLIVGITHQTIEADRDLLVARARISTSSSAGTSTRRTIRSCRAATCVKADANSRSAQFVTLWGGKGRMAASRRAGAHRQPAARMTARGHAVVDGLGRQPARGGSGPSARSGPPRSRSTPATRSVGAGIRPGRPGDRRHAGRHRRRCRPAQRRHPPTRRRDPPRPDHQLPARVDLPVRGRDPGAHLPAHAAPGCARSWSTGWPTGRSGKGGFLQVSGRLLHLRPDRAVRRSGSSVTCGRPVGRRRSGPRDSRHGRLPGVSRPATAATATTCRKRQSACDERASAPAGGGPAGTLRHRFAAGKGRRAGRRADHADHKHKSRLSLARRDRSLSSFDHPGCKAEIPGAPKGYVTQCSWA